LFHVIQLVVGEMISQLRVASNLEDILQKIIEMINYLELQTILKAGHLNPMKPFALSPCEVLD
jgi:hypothetical protein